jgi:hypothetical protein
LGHLGTLGIRGSELATTYLTRQTALGWISRARAAELLLHELRRHGHAPAGPGGRGGAAEGARHSLSISPAKPYKDSHSALPHCFACSPNDGPNPHAGISLPHPLASSLADQRPHPMISPARPDPRQRGQIRVSRPDRDQSRDPSLPGRSESAGLIRIVQLDPSRLVRSESGSESMPASDFGPFILQYDPAMTATGRRSTTSRGSDTVRGGQTKSPN